MKVHLKPVLSCALACLLAAPASAKLANRYSFDSDVTDSVGGANGMVVDAGAAPNHSFGGGQVDLSTNPGETSNNIVEGAYVDLPNGIVSAASSAGAGNFGNSGDTQVSFEFWATSTETRTWSRLGDFGNSNDGEDTSAAGDNANYLLIAANSGRWMDGVEMTNHPADNSEEPVAGINGPTPVGEEQHVVAVYNQQQTQGGATNGTMHLYVGGAEVASGAIAASMDINTIDDVNNWLGRSQWNDPLFAGSYNEFRVYDHALGSGQVERNFAAGADQVGANVPEPASIALLALAGAAVLGLRRRLAA